VTKEGTAGAAMMVRRMATACPAVPPLAARQQKHLTRWTMR